MPITIRAYSSSDDTFIAWKLDAPIAGLRGFALVRLRDGNEETLASWVGPEGTVATAGEHNPTTRWPIQKFTWSDYLARAGDTLRYKVIPMTGPMASLTRRDDLASDWSAEVVVAPRVSKRFQVHFNRGIVASQWLSRRLGPADVPLVDKSRKLDRVVKTVGDPIRDFLGGSIRETLLAMLAEAAAKKRTVYAALYELDDPELIPALIAIGKRAHVLLANGSVKKSGDDQNDEARALLAGKVTLHDRMCAPRGLGHNKFLVLCDASRRPAVVWTGSTNWTMTGLCTQGNNAIVIENGPLAREFKAQWDLLKRAGDAFPPALLAANALPRKRTIDRSRATLWFTRTSEEADLEQARSLINGATQGILFLMFNPGPAGTLLNAIIERASRLSAHYDPTLYMQGVINQDPGTAKNPVGLVHRGQREDAPLDVVLPAAVNTQLAYWMPELRKKASAFAMVHSKVIVVDPFSTHPVVMTGSHNMGPKASRTNDENFLIIENHPTLAAAYASNIMAIYNQYRWRFRMTQDPAAAAAFTGTKDNDSWQHFYFQGFPARELDFWLGVR